MTRTSRLLWLTVALALSVATPASADTFLVFSGGGIPPASDLYTWCDFPPCDVSEPVSCEEDLFTTEIVASPEAGSSLRLRTNIWGGWGIFPQGYEMDLSAYENGEMRFFVKAPPASIGAYNVKVEFKCNPDPIGLPGGVTYTTSIADHGWDGTEDWQEIAIPICDFFPGGVCDTQCLSTVTSPFLSTIELLPFFNTFYIDYVRWHSPNTACVDGDNDGQPCLAGTDCPGGTCESTLSGGSSVEVSGRQLLVDGEPFEVKGMAYAPVAPCENWQAAWQDRPDRYLVDFPLIAASGANAVRLYAPVLTKAMLDAAWDAGLYVIPNFGVDLNQNQCPEAQQFMRDRFRETVLEWKDHPAILFWLVGNEVNAGLTTTELCDEWYPQLDSLAQEGHAAEGPSFHPVGTANTDSTGTSEICLAGCSDDTALPNLDLWGVQVYRGCSFGTLFTEYDLKSDCNRPLVITEFGADAWDSGMGGSENQTMQANCLGTLLDEGDLAAAVNNPAGVSGGQVIFEWADEWWKAECVPTTDWCVQDTCASSTNPNYPDSAINEEWWGIAGLDGADPNLRPLRTAYDRVSDSWSLGSACNMEVVNHNPVTGDTTISFDPAAGSAAHALYYGPLSAVSTYGYTGSVGGLGTSGSSSFTLPAGSLFWVVAPRNGTEGCYGTDSGSNERPCFAPSGSCSVPQAANRTCDCSAP